MATAYHAIHRNIPMSPRKARLVADMIRGKPVGKALEILAFTEKRAAAFMTKVLKSAVANAESREGVDSDRLFVSHATVNEGPRLKRIYPRPRGVATPIARPMCHIRLEVSEASASVAASGTPETT